MSSDQGRRQSCPCGPLAFPLVVDPLCTVHGNRAPEPGRDWTPTTTDDGAVVRQDQAMPMYRKKPVVIEAQQVTFENVHEVAEWCGGTSLRDMGEGEPWVGVSIHTLEGVMRADLDDWIIKGVQGEFYPCKPDIFQATYEAVDE